MTTLPLSELLGATVYDPAGAATGRVREVTLAPQEDPTRIASLIVKTKSGDRVLPFSAISSIDANIHASTKPSDWPAANGSEGLFLLERDLLDQQVIDINGRKVVRVNDVELQIDSVTEAGRPRRHHTRRLRRYRRARRDTPPSARTRSPYRSPCSAAEDSSSYHSVEFCRSHRDRSRAPHQA